VEVVEGPPVCGQDNSVNSWKRKANANIFSDSVL